MRNKRVLIIASHPASLLNFRRQLILDIAEKKWEVHLASPNIDNYADALATLGVDIHQLPLQRTGTNPLFDLFSFFRICWLITKIKPKKLITYTIKPVIYGSLAARFLRVENCYPLITGLGYAFNSDIVQNKLTRIINFLYRQSLKSVTIIFFQNPDDERLFRKKGLVGHDVSTCVVNGSGVDTKHYALVTPPTTITFLLIARLLISKGVQEYIKAAKVIKTKYPHMKFKIVGDIDKGNPDSINPSEIDKWIDEGLVEWKGYLNDVRPAIADSAIYVLPSYREGTPRSVLEAMSMGKPIITTDVPGCRETVINGYNGFLVSAKSVDELVSAMQRFIENPSLVLQMGLRSREIVEQKYDVHDVNELMLKSMGID